MHMDALEQGITEVLISSQRRLSKGLNTIDIPGQCVHDLSQFKCCSKSYKQTCNTTFMVKIQK